MHLYRHAAARCVVHHCLESSIRQQRRRRTRRENAGLSSSAAPSYDPQQIGRGPKLEMLAANMSRCDGSPLTTRIGIEDSIADFLSCLSLLARLKCRDP